MLYGSIAVEWPDSIAYEQWATAIADNGDIAHHAIYRTPGYPLFLSFFIYLLGHQATTGFLIIAAQQLLGIFSGIFLYLLLETIFAPSIALIAGIVFVSSPLQLFYANSVLTEALFTPLLFLDLWLFARIFKNNSIDNFRAKDFALIGFISGLLTLTRPIGQLFLVSQILIGAIYYRGSRKYLINAALCMLVFFALIFPWVQVNYHTYGFSSISQDLGLNMFHRVLDIDQPSLPEDLSDQELKTIYTSALERVRNNKAKVTYFTVYYQLIKQYHGPSYSALEADRRMVKFALEVVKTEPINFLKITINNWIRNFLCPRKFEEFYIANDGVPYLISPHNIMPNGLFYSRPEYRSKTLRNFIFKYFKSLESFRILYFWTFVYGVYKFSCNKKNRSLAGYSILFTILYFSGLTAIFNRSEDRFTVPFSGLIIGFAIYGLFELAQCIREVKLIKYKDIPYGT